MDHAGVRPDEHRRSFDHEETNWFHTGMDAIDEAALRPFGLPFGAVLDAGCGTGAWLRRLERLGPPDGGPFVGFDVSHEAVRLARSRGLRNLLVSSIGRLPFRRAAFGAVTCRHVIEHVEADAAALAEIARVVRPGGLLLLGVPALPWVWTAHDVANQHLRRYRRSDLLRMLRAAGFEPLFVRHVNVLTILPAAAMTLWQRIRPAAPAAAERLHIVPEALNRLLGLYMRLERAVLLRLPVPFGLSLIAVARKT